MTIILVTAMDHGGGIGNNGKLPWERIPEDMSHFRNLTLRQIIAMGRRTWESIGSKPLENRTNLVLTHDKNFVASGARIFHNPMEIQLISLDVDVFVIGGEKMYALFLPFASRIYLTYIDGKFESDTLFPKHNTHKWEVVEQRHCKKGNTSPYDLDFVTLDRIAKE